MEPVEITTPASAPPVRGRRAVFVLLAGACFGGAIGFPVGWYRGLTVAESRAAAKPPVIVEQTKEAALTAELAVANPNTKDSDNYPRQFVGGWITIHPGRKISYRSNSDLPGELVFHGQDALDVMHRDYQRLLDHAGEITRRRQIDYHRSMLKSLEESKK